MSGPSIRKESVDVAEIEKLRKKESDERERAKIMESVAQEQTKRDFLIQAVQELAEIEGDFTPLLQETKDEVRQSLYADKLFSFSRKSFGEIEGEVQERALRRVNQITDRRMFRMKQCIKDIFSEVNREESSSDKSQLEELAELLEKDNGRS